MTDKRIVDLRTYTIRPRRMGDFIKHFDTLAMPLLLKHLGTPLGFYTTSVGTLNQFIHVWMYDSLEDYEKRSLARDTDPAFNEYLEATRDMVLAQENKLIKPTTIQF